jgi:thiol-disulfide isomerase/thioredoxin
VVQGFDGKARFVVENYGDSELAERFGVTRYPAIFVEDVLVATPNDFGFYGNGQGARTGRYAPLKSEASHRRFQADLERMIELILAGRKEDARGHAAPQSGSSPENGPAGLATLPAFQVTDLDGNALTREDLAGRVVLVEFWATWCPPCRGTLRWLGGLQEQYGDRLAVVGVAVESGEADVRKLAAELDLPVTWVLGTPELAEAFGGVGAVPMLHLFDREGRAAATFYGAPPDLHAEAEAKLASLLE